MGLDSVEFVMEVEDEFGIKIADPDAEQMRTIGDVVRYLAHREGIDMDAANMSSADASRVEHIRRRVHGIISDMFRVHVDSLSDSTHFVRDLEMD